MSEAAGLSEAAPDGASLTPVERAEAMIARAEARVAARAQPKAGDTAPTAYANGAAERPVAPTNPPVERAEELLNRTGERLGYWATMMKQSVLKTAALVREEAEDILADAQKLRNHQP